MHRDNRRRHLSLLASLVLAGCSGGVGSGLEDVAIQTVPAGAACEVSRGRDTLGNIESTPGSLRVSHSDQALTIICRKPGYETARTTLTPVYQGIQLGRLLTGGAAAVVVDAAKSEDFRYDPAGATLTLRLR